MLGYDDLKKLLFKLDPEHAHLLGECFLRGLEWMTPAANALVKANFVTDDRLTQEYFGKTFLNPVGLGAGFDKNATMVKAMAALGFGFTEIGTVTPMPQPGNPKPRLFRHVEARSLQNAMGFNNDGMLKIQKRLRKVTPFALPVGVNIGKNKATPADRALEDYKSLIRGFEEMADYLVINVSSPNTPGLRDLQNEAFIGELFDLAGTLTQKPVLLKVAPDLTMDEALPVCTKAVEHGAAGIVATNTTNDYALLPGAKDFGGLSGEVLREKSFLFFRKLAEELYGKTMLISVGGIATGEEAYRRIRSGASLVQVYSGLVYGGPGLIGKINRELLACMEKDGVSHISEAIGTDLKG